MITVNIANQQDCMPLDAARLKAAVRAVLRAEGVGRAQVSLAVVDDPTIAELHERYLGRQGPTDVLSFLLDEADGRLEGEVVVSAETAAAQAGRFGWPAADELLLYVVHGTLHLLGYDDATCSQRRAMRRRERRFVARLGLAGRYRREKFGRGCARPMQQRRQGRGREQCAQERRAEEGGRRGPR